MRIKYLLLLVVALVGVVAADDSCLYERMMLKKAQERCAFTPCRRTLFPVPRESKEAVKVIEPVQVEPRLKIVDTLTSQVSKLITKLTPVRYVMAGIKLVAKFFHTTESTETTEHYWDELKDAANAMVDEAIDDSILAQTDAAVDRLSEDLQLYMDDSNTTRAFSAFVLTEKMDTELNTILSLYDGMQRPERGLLHYLDMATTRLVLWQTTAFRYINDLTIHGQLESGITVCDMVRKWSLAYDTETSRIVEHQLPALHTWLNTFIGELNLDCQMHCHDPAFGNWEKTVTCKVWDGYHGKNLNSTETFCRNSHGECPSCDFVCFNFCPPSTIVPHIERTQDNHET